MEDYPECYAPYTMSEEDKTKLVAYWEAENYCNGGDLYLQDSLNAVNYALENGEFTSVETYGSSILDWVEEYNNGSINNCGAPEGTISITAGKFNGSNTLYGVGSEVSIEIEFETANSMMTMGNAVTTYRTHPAFWWDNNSNGTVDNGEMLSGIWVGKFESTPDKSSTCYSTPNSANCNNTTQNPTVLPNEASLRYQPVSKQFITSQNISKTGNVYGISNTLTDAHMMKNSEWGAVAYLTHSEYGINKEVRINNYGYLTGCGAAEDNASPSTTCAITYGSGISEYPQSTTGNISGIFDMSGGAWDYVMGHYGITIVENFDFSEFTILPDNKYFDLYDTTQFNGYYLGNTIMCTLETCSGHSLNETVNWYNDYSGFVDSVFPWLRRGGSTTSNAGTFLFNSGGGGGYSYYSWRSVIVNGFSS